MKFWTLPAILVLVASPALAAPSPGPTAAPAEMPFVSDATTYLKAHFPRAQDAERAGYIRYTDEDETGAISYANRSWTSPDAHHPSQLWYDVDGRLLGADFSVPYGDTPPTLWGILPGRWERFGAHVHYGLASAGGGTKYGAAGKTFVAAGGSLADPTAAELVSAGIAKSTGDVRFVFAFPAIWDLQLWILPNPNGAFAEKNPNVHPASPPKNDSM